jgi:hypothetical protein
VRQAARDISNAPEIDLTKDPIPHITAGRASVDPDEEELRDFAQ